MAKQVWITDDGKSFDTEAEAAAHEQRMATRGRLVKFFQEAKQKSTGPGDPADYAAATPGDIADFLLDHVPAAVDAILACADK